MADEAGAARLTDSADVVAMLGPDLRPGAPQVGVDDDGVVRVRVAADGGVAGVQISPRWRDRLRGADALAAAVLAAYRQALLKRMAARLVNGPGPSPEAPSRTDVADEGWLEGIREALERTYRQLAEVSRPRPPEQVVTGPARIVRVRVAGSAAAELSIDAPRAADRDPDLVAEDARAALDRVREA
jgi:hypothetical protein